MPLTDRGRVRLTISDKPRIVQEMFAGDGASTVFVLTHPNPTDVSAVAGGTGLMFDTTADGKLTLDTAADEVFVATYTSVEYTDDEIDDMLEREGNVNGAALFALRGLIMSDRYRMWRAPDGTLVNNTILINARLRMYELLSKEAGADLLEIPDGSIVIPDRGPVDDVIDYNEYGRHGRSVGPYGRY